MNININITVETAEEAIAILTKLSQSATPPVPVMIGSAPLPAETAPLPEIPVAKPKAYTMDDIIVAAKPLLDAGRIAELQALVSQFGVAAMPELAPEQLGAFAMALRGLGAKL